eukprot:Gb_28691 [translate_table: standard]
MMHMTFYWGKQVTLLFDDWKTQTWLSYSLTLVAVFLFSVFHEYIVNLRSRFNGVSTAKDPSDLRVPFLRKPSNAYTSKGVESVLFGLNAGLGYLLMLAVMSFNGGVFIAAILGFIVGYFIFRSGSEAKQDSENSCACG